MPAETLESELLTVPGVASAEVDVGDGTTPAGVRVSLAPDADARRVGVEVQRVLAGHGMRSRFSSGDAKPSAPSSSAAPTPQPPAPMAPSPVLRPAEAPPQPEVDPSPPMATLPTPPVSAPPVLVPVPKVRSVSVEERSDGLTASVLLADGRRASREIGFEADELDAAIIAAVAEAAGASVTRAAVEWLEVDGGNVVTVVVKRVDDSLAAGAGIMRVGRAYAVGVATRSALES